MRSFSLPAVAVVMGLLALSPRVEAQDGLAFLHDTVRLGSRICMATHFHSGTGSGASRKQAMAAAIGDWAGFTAWEYGPQWGSWRLSETKRASCNGGGGQWTCTVEARPCKPARR